jgi:hypothetical protein
LNGVGLEVLAAAWSDVWPHHTRGGLWIVEPVDELLPLATAMRDDDTAFVQAMLSRGVMRRSDDIAIAQWGREDRWFDVVVVKPWVLACPQPATGAGGPLR